MTFWQTNCKPILMQIFFEIGIVSSCLSYLGANSSLLMIHTSPISINTYTEHITYGDVRDPVTVSTIFQFAVFKTFIQQLTNTLV